MYGRILVAIDESRACNEVLKQAARLALMLEAELHVLCVQEYPPALQVVAQEVELPKAVADGDFEEFCDQARCTARDLGIEPKSVELMKGDPAKAILSHIKEVGFDLVVLGRRGKGFMHRFRPTSTTHKVMASSDCPVVVFPIPCEPLAAPPHPPSLQENQRV